MSKSLGNFSNYSYNNESHEKRKIYKADYVTKIRMFKLEGRQFILLEDLPSNKNPKPLLDKKNF